MTNCLLEVLAQPDSHSKSITSQWVTGLSQTQSGGVETGTGSGTRNDSIVSVRLNQWPRLTGWDDLALWVGHSHSLSLWVWPNIHCNNILWLLQRKTQRVTQSHSLSQSLADRRVTDWLTKIGFHFDFQIWSRTQLQSNFKSMIQSYSQLFAQSFTQTDTQAFNDSSSLNHN